MKNSKEKLGLKKLLVKLLGNEKYQNISIPIFAVVLSLLAGSLILLAIGKNPIDTYTGFLQGSGIFPKPKYAGGVGMITDFTNFLDSLAPMIFAALAVTVALKAGLFNIGVSGQMLIGGFFATILVGYSGLPAIVSKPLVILISVAFGALTGILIGYLKYKFNINEVVTSIMLNYIISYLTSFFINTYFVDIVSRQSRNVAQEASLTIRGMEINGIDIKVPLAIILAIICAIVIAFLLNKTKLGYEIKAVGLNKKAANYAGINVNKTIIKTMAISGALAGAAGAAYYLGYFTSIQPRVLASLGYDSIATSLLGNMSPIGSIFSSILITILNTGATYMSSKVGVVKEIAGVITGLILLFSAAGAFIKYKVEKAKMDIELASNIENLDYKLADFSKRDNLDEEVKNSSDKGGDI